MTLAGAAARTVKLPEAFGVFIVPWTAVIVLSPAPAIVGVIVTPSTSPPAVITALTDPTYELDVSVTVPVYDPTVLLLASWAVTRTLNPVPAVLEAAESGVVPPDIVTRNFVAVPGTNCTVAV